MSLLHALVTNALAQTPQPQEKLTEFILACQDEETGGFSDRPGDWVRIVTVMYMK